MDVAIQQALPKQFNVQLSYVGNHGTRMGVGQNINDSRTLNLGASCTSKTNPTYCSTPQGVPLYEAVGKTASVSEFFLGYSSNYDSLQAELNRHFSGNLGVTTSFTWGNGMDNATGGNDDGGLLFWADPRHSYGPDDFDHRFNLEESVSWVLPFGPHQRWLNSGPAASILGGWQLSGVISAYSGLPFNVTAGGTNSINTSGTTQMANINGGFHVQHGIGPNSSWFDTTSFSQPIGCAGGQGTPCPLVYGTSIGDVSRNAYRGPGYIQNNASLFKNFVLHENWTFDFRCDAFQLTNSPEFNSPQNSLNSGTFGHVTGTVGSGTGINGIGGGRALQLAGTLHF